MKDTTSARARELYDEVPYPSHPQAETHPERLAVIGRLFGVPVAPPDRCRVIEIGCCDGGNLIPMAFRLPESTFVGLDISPRSIERGQRHARALGLDNVELIAADVRQAGAGSAQADYIICHGLWSWVEPPVQQAILRLIEGALAPGGVALLSYNCWPGWHMLRPMRDLMRFHDRSLTGPASERVAQCLDMVRAMAAGTRSSAPAYSTTLERALNFVGNFSPDYLFHDFLAPINQPYAVLDFVETIRDAGLQYLGEASFGTMMHYGLDDTLGEQLRAASGGLVEMQQYLDFARNTTFRWSLLCRRDQPLRRTLDETSIAGLHVASLAEREETEPTSGEASPSICWKNGDGLELTDPSPELGRILDMLWEQAGTVPVEQVAEACELAPATLAGRLIQMYAIGMVDLAVTPRPWLPTPELPKANRMVRRELLLGETGATTRRHKHVALSRFHVHVLNACDGRSDHEAIARAIVDAVMRDLLELTVDGESTRDPEIALQVARKMVPEELERLTQLGLFEAD